RRAARDQIVADSSAATSIAHRRPGDAASHHCERCGAAEIERAAVDGADCTTASFSSVYRGFAPPIGAGLSLSRSAPEVSSAQLVSLYRAAAGPTGSGGRGGPPSSSWRVCRGRAGAAFGDAFGAVAAPLGAAFGAGFFGSALLASLFASPLFASLLFVSFLPAPPCDGAGDAAGGGAVSGAGSLLISARGQEKSS